MKAKVIMLESNDSNIIRHNNNQDLLYLREDSLDVISKRFESYVNIYLIDESAEIEEGDWYYSKVLNKFEQLTELPKGDKDWWLEDCFKIIASTETLSHIIHDNTVLYPKGEQIIVPQLSEQSIKLLIDYYNKNGKIPDEVDIKDWLDDVDSLFEHSDVLSNRISLNHQGEVDITIPEEKMYSKQEVINLIKKHRIETYNGYSSDKWIKQNLK